MRVELVREWMGHLPGSILNIKDAFAQSLIDRKSAKLLQEGGGDKTVSSRKRLRRQKDKSIKSMFDKSM